MKILVCVKQVPDMESRFKPDGAGVWYSEHDLAFLMNEYDAYAVEQAVLLKEQLGGEPELTVISIGPDRVVESIKKALAMGCDRGVHVQDPTIHSKDSWQVASAIASYAKAQGCDLILTGMQSLDRGSAQVGVYVAEMLGYACATTVIKFQYADGVVTVRRELEGGTKGIVQLAMPAVVTCQLGLNVPRYPTLPNIMKAKKKEILVIPVTDLLHAERRSVTVSFHPSARKGTGTVLEGDLAEQVDRLIAILKEKTTVLR